jgi:hypothetical protein
MMIDLVDRNESDDMRSQASGITASEGYGTYYDSPKSSQKKKISKKPKSKREKPLDQLAELRKSM